MGNTNRCKKVTEKLYANLSNAAAPCMEGRPPDSFFCMLEEPLYVDERMDDRTEEGRRNLYAFADAVPLISKEYQDSGKRVSEGYQIVLAARSLEKAQEDENKKVEYEAARRKLYEENGAPTRMYSDYLESLKRFDLAERAYCAEKNEGEPIDLVKLEKEKNLSYQILMGSNKKEIEKALFIVKSYERMRPGATFSAAARKFVQEVKAGEAPVSCAPENWIPADDCKKLMWKPVTVCSRYPADFLHASIARLRSGLDKRYADGFWGFTADSQADETQTALLQKANQSSSMKNFGLFTEVVTVKLDRNWFNESLLDFPDVYLPGLRPESVCNGTLLGADSCMLPVIPSELLLCRRTAVYNDFSEEEKKLIEDAKSWENAKLICGPFGVSANWRMSGPETFTAGERKRFGAASKLSLGGPPQLIGVVNFILKPGFPQRNFK